MIETILVILFPLVAHGRSQLVSASGHPEHGSGELLHALDHQGNVVVGFTPDASPTLDEMWWLAWMPFREFVRQVLGAACAALRCEARQRSANSNMDT